MDKFIIKRFRADPSCSATSSSATTQQDGQQPHRPTMTVSAEIHVSSDVQTAETSGPSRLMTKDGSLTTGTTRDRYTTKIL